ncbi:hypothetical protein [Roseateles sp.]|uniref:hypothetical protein n=1 Tax=Roseateles sp. TaxID=1971397 RepID=UPI00286C2352|nr:hypothetical protein [Roseateles sp.]
MPPPSPARGAASAGSGDTEPALQALAQQCLRGSFFLTGEALALAPKPGAQLAAPSHTVAVHGDKHARVANLPRPSSWPRLTSCSHTAQLS